MKKSDSIQKKKEKLEARITKIQQEINRLKLQKNRLVYKEKVSDKKVAYVYGDWILENVIPYHTISLSFEDEIKNIIHVKEFFNVEDDGEYVFDRKYFKIGRPSSFILGLELNKLVSEGVVKCPNITPKTRTQLQANIDYLNETYRLRIIANRLDFIKTYYEKFFAKEILALEITKHHLNFLELSQENVRLGGDGLREEYERLDADDQNMILGILDSIYSEEYIRTTKNDTHWIKIIESLRDASTILQRSWKTDFPMKMSELA